jgi:uncharacterized membrane protein
MAFHASQLDLLDLSARHLPNVGPFERVLSVLLGTRCTMRSFERTGLQSLAALGAGAFLLHRGLGGRCALYGALDLVPDPRHARRGLRRALRIGASIEIEREPHEIHAFLRDSVRLGCALEGVRRVEEIDPVTSRWFASSGEPGECETSWTVRVVEDVQSRRFAWESLEDGPFLHRGSIELVPAQRGTGTLVVLDVTWYARFAALTALRLRGRSPASRARSALRRAKELLEAGEVPVPGDRVQRPLPARSRGAQVDWQIDESSRESFPASDSPAFTPATSIGGSARAEDRL